MDSDRSMKNLIQSENNFFHSINRLEAQMSHLINIVKDRNEASLLTQSLTVPTTSSHIDENQESWYLKDFDQDLISPQNLELDQCQPINKLASFHFNKIELEHECDPDPQLCDSVPIFETPVFLPNLD